MDLKEYDTLIEYHDQVKMGIHIGMGVKSNDIPFYLENTVLGSLMSLIVLNIMTLIYTIT